MAEERNLARFTREISAEGVIDDLLRYVPEEELVATLAALAYDRGYRVRLADLRIYLSGLDARFC